MRNYTQIDTQEKEEDRVFWWDILGVIVAIVGVTVLIWGLI